MPTETPREPDRFETATDALERIARAFDANPTAQHSGAAVASILRYLAHEAPAAAPAAEPAICDSTMDSDELFYHCTLPPGHVGPHKDRDVAEWTDETHHDGEPVAPAGCAQPPDPERDLNRHNAMLVEAWREEFNTLCKVLFPGHSGPIGWKHIQAKVKALADGGKGKT